MNLESMTMEVRPRSPWEAMDLAVRLTITHWKILFSSWLITILPIFLVVSIILLNDYPYWAFIILWFLKPLYDRVPLFVLSRVIFAETISVKDVMNAIPSFFKTGIFSTLTLYRLDPGRSFALPVRQLEGLKGKRRRERMNALRRSANNREVMLLILCFHIEALITWGLIGLALMMLPAHIALQNAESLFTTEPGLLLNIVSMLLYFLIMMVVETLYVAGGFILYLNRRIILEGWDIELSFKKLRQRQVQEKAKQASMGSLILTVVMIFSAASSLIPVHTVEAKEYQAPVAYKNILPPVAERPLPAEQSGEVIKQVMNDPVFNRMQTISRLKYIGNDDNKSSNQGFDDSRFWLTDVFEAIGNTIAFIFEAGLWVLAFIALFLLIKYRDRLNLGYWRQQKVSTDVPDMLFGLDVREESLPDDVSAEALRLFNQNNYRAALALLYRATLAFLVKHYDFVLEKGATEGDCLRIVTRQLQLPTQNEVEYFIDLTRAWQLTAYAHRNVSAQQMEALCRDWALFYDKKLVNQSRAAGDENE
jgi:hypothetical protein